jgi:Fic family protein
LLPSRGVFHRYSHGHARHARQTTERYHPYTKIDFVTAELMIHRNTAAKYLEELVRIGVISKHRLRKDNYYLNDALFERLRAVGTYGAGGEP